MIEQYNGGFTLPGEAGYEDLTIELALRWGADMIRDSDGTSLSNSILESDYGIYSTLCVIRDHNEFLNAHPQYRQQSFLMTPPKTATRGPLQIDLLAAFFDQQFAVNDHADSIQFWQVFDRTLNIPLDPESWRYDAADRCVIIEQPRIWHQYTVTFMAWRIWEEISMYNHVTNRWEKEHQMQLDPRHPEAAEYLCGYLERWCVEHPRTEIVRFTSMFYNFVWIWSSDAEHRNMYTDWASYDFTVSPLALRQFERKYGYALTGEDFINGGLLHPCHMPAGKKQLDYMEFVEDLVVSLGKRLIDIVHRHRKKAYLFYDDSWIGTEPGGERFSEFGFDGLIKCVFSAYESRLCTAVSAVPVHELRLHPYLFPVGLSNKPTFAPGGTPAEDALRYWAQVRRALLREPVDRIGLGGYLHYVREYPAFADAMDTILTQFRELLAVHRQSAPQKLASKIGVLTTWGAKRRWTCGGHYHEHPDLDLLNLLESLAGMPYEVLFYSFEEIANGVPKDISVLINAGFAGSAWSGGDAWMQPEVIESVTAFVHGGGVLLGVNQPSAVPGQTPVFRAAHLLGVDQIRSELLCHDLRSFLPVSGYLGNIPVVSGAGGAETFPIDNMVHTVQSCDGDAVLITSHPFGHGMGVYLSAYRHSPENAFALQRLLLAAKGMEADVEGLPDNPYVDCAVYPDVRKAIFVNNNDVPQDASALADGRRITCTLPSYGMQVISY